MLTDRPAGRTTARYRRDDGDATKARIMEAAGPLFAERGFADVTSKEICERAKANIAAVNYHFGSREGLYQSVLQEMHAYFATGFMPGLADGAVPPRQRLEAVLDRLSAAAIGGDAWQVRLWAREWMSPSALAPDLMQENALPHETLRGLLGEITGIAADDPTLDFCFLQVMSLFMTLLVTVSGTHTPFRIVHRSDAATMAAHLKTFIFAGLDGYAAAYAGGGPSGG